MHIALKERQVKGTTAAVCSVDESNKNTEVRKLEGLSKFHNFSFEFEGISFWRFYGIGSEPAALEHNIYDKLKRDWVAMFATVQTEERQPQHNQPHTHSEESVPEANMGWALAKARSGSSQFSEKVKDYLTNKFDIGEKTGQKVSAEQVAKDMRNAKTHDNQRLFGREDWLTKLQVQGFFSRLACVRRKQGWYRPDTSEEVGEGDKVGEQHHAVEDVV